MRNLRIEGFVIFRSSFAGTPSPGDADERSQLDIITTRDRRVMEPALIATFPVARQVRGANKAG
jgi:hypothetical protein